nr:MFS transporter [Bacteroidota bacterium]
ASRDQRPIDIIGSILWFFSIGILLFALNKGHRLGWTSMLFWILIGSSMVLAILFIIREIKSKNPIFPLGMLGGIKGVAALLIGVLVFSLIAGNAFLMPFFLENIKYLSSSEVGGLFLFFSVAAAIFSFLAGRLALRYKQRNLITIALLIGSLACIGFYFAMSLNGLVPVIIFLILLGIMVGLFLPNNNSLIMGLAPEGKKGVYSGIYDTFNNIGLAAGACIFEVVFAGKTDHILQTVQDKISSKNWMLPGFLDSYFLATVICVIGFLISLWLIKMKPTTGIITNSKKMVKPAIFHTFDNPKNMCTRNQQTL